MFGLGIAKAGVKAIAGGNAQQQLGIQSPHMPEAIDRIGRFLFTVTGVWIGVTWYTAYANTRVAPGSGPTLVLPGLKGAAQYSPARADPATPSFGKGTGTGTGANSNGVVQAVGASGPMRMRLVRTALAMVGQTRFHYQAIRPMPSSLLANPCITDCSGFVTLVYKSCQAPDPNGLNYNGQGFTGDEAKHGTPVKEPNLGDLAIWSDHVVIVVALSPMYVVGFGSTSDPGPIRRSMKQQQQIQASVGQTFIGYRSYV